MMSPGLSVSLYPTIHEMRCGVLLQTAFDDVQGPVSRA